MAISNLVHESNVSGNLIVRKTDEAKRTDSVLQRDKHLEERSEVWRFCVKQRRLYHITLQELPGTSPNVSSQHERATMDVNLLGKKQLISVTLL